MGSVKWEYGNQKAKMKEGPEIEKWVHQNGLWSLLEGNDKACTFFIPKITDLCEFQDTLPLCN